MVDLDHTERCCADKRYQRCRPWVHNILMRHSQFGAYHCMLQELRLDDGRFQRLQHVCTPAFVFAVHAEQVPSLGSEGEDEVGLWGLELQETLDKTSLTSSEGTEEPGSPARCTRPHSLSPGGRNRWMQGEAEAVEHASTTSVTDMEREQEPLRMFCKDSDSQTALEDLAHYEFLVHLKKASSSAELLDHLTHNGSISMRRPSSRDEELPPAMWSPGIRRRSPERADAVRMQQACPFCRRTYQRGASLRDHIKYCQERDGGHMVCPLCGYTATHRAQMEQHLEFHNQVQDKSTITYDQGMESRKFKCLQCGKAFKYKHHLKEHLRIHSGEKPYECSNCKKRFSHSGSYSSHLSSKKCLNAGGTGGGSTGGMFNGHSQYSQRQMLSTSPSAGGGRNSNDKGSPLDSQIQDHTMPLGQIPEAPHLIFLQDLQNPSGFPRALDLSRLWEPSSEFSMRASVLKGATLLPYLHSGTKFEQMLQEMLHGDGKRAEDTDKEGGPLEKRRVIYNGGGSDMKVSPDKSVRRSVELERGDVGVMCQWCSQLFPNIAVLLQHERYLCKMNREAVEVTDSLHGKDHHSPPLFSTRSDLQPENSNQSEIPNGLSGNKSPLQMHNWHSVPQQLLVAMHSPQHSRHDPLSSQMYWSNQESRSPSQPITYSPELASPRARKRIHSSGFGSPVCLDLSSCPLELSSPHIQTGAAQNEPLDLSLPKQLPVQDRKTKAVNGNSSNGEKRELLSQHLRRLSPKLPLHLPLHHHPIYSGAGPPLFPGSIFNRFPLFNQSGLGLPGHDGITSMPFNQPANGPGFVSPMAYMMDAEAEAVLKKIHQDRQTLMGLDYLSLMEEGMDGEGAPGRKRLKKTDEGLYACDICEKTFQKSSSLLRHKYEHTGKRPHECKICNKAFKHKHHLIEHSRLHSGEKPYQCDKCGKRFSHSGSYSQHMNHRYAYCSKDNDLDQDHDEMPLTPGPGTHLRGASMEDTQTAHSFLSDSSLDGAPETLKEEEEEEDVEEDKDAGVSDGHFEDVPVSLLQVEGGAVQESHTKAKEEPRERNSGEDENHTDGTESDPWDTENHNQDSDKCELSQEITDLQLQMIKT
ncbi:zinc finger E-box-binding homeobox 2-like [Thalassophryne amazonica]|uniref:zinc finger E-box-binding homeobox 2-like n=1 Tax=Thalassophryne amazonica TaxID=390379 RepID=UPI0014720237|nr:zinc finger E-box-binding homeobox 2-like [Thalassophryne amazonica]